MLQKIGSNASMREIAVALRNATSHGRIPPNSFSTLVLQFQKAWNKQSMITPTGLPISNLSMSIAPHTYLEPSGYLDMNTRLALSETV